MDQPSFNSKLETSPLAIANAEGLLHRFAEIKHTLDEINRKVDSILSNPVAPAQILTQNGPPDSEEFSSLGAFEEDFPRDPELPPRTLPASMVFRDGVWADPPPSTSTAWEIPPPPVIPSYDIWSRENLYDPHDENTFPGGGNDHHQSTEQWMDTSSQQAEASTSLAAAKPQTIEYENQSESSSPAASTPGGRYDRYRNTEEKKQCFALICKILDITWTGDELLALQTIIRRLPRGVVPVVEELTDGISKAERGRRTRAARHAYFEELRRLVGPWTEKRSELKTLNSVLVNVTMQDGGEEQGYEPYHVFGLNA